MIRRTCALLLFLALAMGAFACGSQDTNPTETGTPGATLTAKPRTNTPEPDGSAEETSTQSETPGGTETQAPDGTETPDDTETPGSETPTETSTDGPIETETENGDPNATPTGTSSDCNGPDPNAEDLYQPGLPEDHVLRLTDKHTVSLASYFPQDLEQLGADFSVREDEAGQLRRDAAESLREMVSAAADDGITIRLVSGFRSCATQIAVFNGHVANLGLKQAERESARPGHSEHQLGLAADISAPSVGYELAQALGDTDEGRWLTNNAARFGFVLSYPAGAEAEATTGYLYEPWHWRFVGSRANARAFNSSGMYLNKWLIEQGN